jgi:hypothetical protein
MFVPGSTVVDRLELGGWDGAEVAMQPVVVTHVGDRVASGTMSSPSLPVQSFSSRRV